MGVCVVAVDIGSVRPPSKFAWAAFDAAGRDVDSGANPESAVSALVPSLLAGAQSALLLEAPMSVPFPGGQPDARRPDLEQYIRWMQEACRFKPSTISRRFSVAAGFYRTCVIDAVLEYSRPTMSAGRTSRPNRPRSGSLTCSSRRC
jgi:hypothetical protein